MRVPSGGGRGGVRGLPQDTRLTRLPPVVPAGGRPREVLQGLGGLFGSLRVHKYVVQLEDKACCLRPSLAIFGLLSQANLGKIS